MSEVPPYQMRKAPGQRARSNLSPMPRGLPGGACAALLVVVAFLVVLVGFISRGGMDGGKHAATVRRKK